MQDSTAEMVYQSEETAPMPETNQTTVDGAKMCTKQLGEAGQMTSAAQENSQHRSECHSDGHVAIEPLSSENAEVEGVEAINAFALQSTLPQCIIHGTQYGDAPPSGSVQTATEKSLPAATAPPAAPTRRRITFVTPSVTLATDDAENRAQEAGCLEANCTSCSVM